MELAKNRIYEMITRENSLNYSMDIEYELKRELYKVLDKYYDISNNEYEILISIKHK